MESSSLPPPPVIRGSLGSLGVTGKDHILESLIVVMWNVSLINYVVLIILIIVKIGEATADMFRIRRAAYGECLFQIVLALLRGNYFLKT